MPMRSSTAIGGIWILAAMTLVAGCSARRGAAVAASPPHSGPPPAGEGADGVNGANFTNGAALEEVIAYAQAQIGKPYCWGGEGPGCFDCGGLAQMAWSKVGVKIPRTSQAIAESVPEIDESDDLRAGDILWWPQGHVAIYAGDGFMIEALNARKGVVRRPIQAAKRPSRVLRPVRS